MTALSPEDFLIFGQGGGLFGGTAPDLRKLPSYLLNGSPMGSAGAFAMPSAPTDMSAQARTAPPGVPMDIQPPQAPQGGGFVGGLSNGLANNSNMLMAMGAALMGGKGFGGALESGMAGGQLDRRNRSTAETERALMQRGLTPEMARMVAGNPALLNAVVQQNMGLTGGTDDTKEFEYAKRQGFTGNFEQWMQRKRATAAGKFGLQPFYGRDASGNPVMMQPGSDGIATQTQLPPGVTLAGKEPVKFDAGTHFVLLDPITRQQIGVIPKDLKGAAAAKELGEIQGQAQGELPGAEMTAARTIKQIDEFIGSKGFGEVFGKLDQFRPNWTMSDQGAEALTRFKQLSGRAFLEGRMMLKGGGAITDFESNKAEAAIARLERSLNEADAKTALEDFKEAVREGATKLRVRAGQSPAAAPPAGADLKKKYGLE
jgi:hypothetical protein